MKGGKKIMNIQVFEFPPCTNDFDMTFETIITANDNAILNGHTSKVDIVAHFGKQLGLDIESITLKE
jgi:hypothetical protein